MRQMSVSTRHNTMVTRASVSPTSSAEPTTMVCMLGTTGGG